MLQLSKGRSSTANAGTKVAVLLETNGAVASGCFKNYYYYYYYYYEMPNRSNFWQHTYAIAPGFATAQIHIWYDIINVMQCNIIRVSCPRDCKLRNQGCSFTMDLIGTVASRCFPHPTLISASEQTLKDLKRSQGYQRRGEGSGFGELRLFIHGESFIDIYY